MAKSSHPRTLVTGDKLTRAIGISEILHTRVPSIDYLSNMGGLVYGRIYELFGPEHVGKSSLCVRILKAAIDNGVDAYVLDTENAYDRVWLNQYGIDMSKVTFSDPVPETLEQAIDDIILFMETKKTKHGLVLCDSLSNLPTEAEVQAKSISEVRPATHAVRMSLALRIICSKAWKYQTIFLFVGHQKTNFMAYGKDSVFTIGGKALAFNAAVRFWITSTGSVSSRPDIARIFKINTRQKSKFRDGNEVWRETQYGISSNGLITDEPTYIDLIEKLNLAPKASNGFYLVEENGQQKRIPASRAASFFKDAIDKALYERSLEAAREANGFHKPQE